MKIIAAFILIGFLSCSSSKEAETQKVSDTIDSVYYQKWIAGVRGGGSGINFFVTLKKSLEKDIVLKKVAFESYEANFKKLSETNYVAYIKTNSNQKDLNLDINPEKEYGNKAPEVQLKRNEANLFFIINGKQIIKNLQNVKEKEMLAYPSMEKPKN
jgi:hypothetical protein